MHHDGFRPTLANTLHEIAVVSWAIWTDYMDCVRARRRARVVAWIERQVRRAPRHADEGPARDLLPLLVAVLVVALAALLACDGWSAFVDTLALLGGTR